MARNRIVLYADKQSRASATSLADEFRRALGNGVAIVEADADAVREGILDGDTLAFVLPGIIGEDSLYPAHLGEAGNEAVRRYVANGGAFLGLCAGAYHAASSVEYAPEWGARKTRKDGLLALFNGAARGPVPGLGIAAAAPDAYHGCTVAPVVLEDGAKADIAYSCGPAFSGVANDAQILARYDTAEKPVAAFAQKYGRGLVILSGVLPQYGAPDGWTMPQAPSSLDLLVGKIAPHEAQRKKLWDSMAALILKNGMKP